MFQKARKNMHSATANVTAGQVSQSDAKQSKCWWRELAAEAVPAPVPHPPNDEESL